MGALAGLVDPTSLHTFLWATARQLSLILVIGNDITLYVFHFAFLLIIYFGMRKS